MAGLRLAERGGERMDHGGGGSCSRKNVPHARTSGSGSRWAELGAAMRAVATRLHLSGMASHCTISINHGMVEVDTMIVEGDGSTVASW